MRDAIQAELMMRFIVSPELSFRIPVDLEYDAADPFAVRFTFHLPGDTPVTWAFARDLLLEGLSAPAGDGDVHIAPVSSDRPCDILLRLQVGEERALFRASGPPLITFLDRTNLLVPMGRERAVADFDRSLEEELERILAGDTPEWNAG